MNRRSFVKYIGYSGPAAILLSKIGSFASKVEPTIEKVLRYVVSPGQRWFVLNAEGVPAPQIISVLGKFNQGGNWVELTGEQYTITGLAAQKTLWIVEDVAKWIEEIRVIYQ